MPIPRASDPIAGQWPVSVSWRAYLEALDKRLTTLANTTAPEVSIPDAGRLIAGDGVTLFGSIDYGQVATVSLRVLPDSGVGAGLVKITRDAYGRVEGTEAATTDDLAEGAANLYFTDERANAAARSESRLAATAIGGHRVVRSTSATHIDIADSGDATHGDDTLGITAGAASAGAAIAVITRGKMIEPSWAWTPGDPVFLSGAGLLSQTPPPYGFVQVVGFAESATSMFINIQPPIYFD